MVRLRHFSKGLPLPTKYKKLVGKSSKGKVHVIFYCFNSLQQKKAPLNVSKCAETLLTLGNEYKKKTNGNSFDALVVGVSINFYLHHLAKQNKLLPNILLHIQKLGCHFLT